MHLLNAMDVLMDMPLDEAVKRLNRAQAETQRVIDKEMRYSPEFRNDSLLAEYRSHMDALNHMLTERLGAEND